jgi:hypothetical protein
MTPPSNEELPSNDDTWLGYPDPEEPPLKFIRKEDGVWAAQEVGVGDSRLQTLTQLGPYEQVAEAMTNFLAGQDYGEKVDG